MATPRTFPVRKPLARLRRGGIRFQIFLLVSLIILPFAALFGWIYKERYEIRRSYAMQAELEVAQGLASNFNTYLDGIRKQSLSVGHALRILPAAHEGQVRKLLSTAARHSNSINSMSWVSPKGIVLVSSMPVFDGRDLSETPYFRGLSDGRETALGDLIEEEFPAGKVVIGIATAIRGNRGELKGVVVVGVEPTRLHEVALTQKRAKGGALALFDSKGTLVYHNFITAPTWEQRSSWHETDEILRKALRAGQAQEGVQRLKLTADREWLSARVPIAGTGWIAGAGRSKESAFEPVKAGMIKDALMGAAVLGMALLLAYLLGRNISVPLRRLEGEAQEMVTGNPITGEDDFAPEEVRSLRHTILAMSSELIGRTTRLQESEESLRTVIDSVYDAVVIHGIDGRIVEVNGRSLEMFRLTRDDLCRITIADLSEGVPAIETMTPLWREVLSGDTKLFEWRSRRPYDGNSFDTEVFLCPVRYQGKLLVMANVRDISERKKVARELQHSRDQLEIRVQERTKELARTIQDLKKETEQRLAAVEDARRKEQLLIQQSRLAAMSEMLVNISHQWRQPLNIIGLVVQELGFEYQQGSLSPERMKDGTAKAMEVISSLSQTINEFSNYLSPDKEKGKFSVKDTLEKALQMLEAELKDTTVTVDLAEAQTIYVEGFRNEYLQVILNVLINARDVLRERQVADPRIDIKLSTDNGRSLVIITDNGGGIDSAILEKIFDPYFTTKGPDKGTGIGLFMSKNIIERSMGGTLTVQNGTSGAEFRIEV